MATAKKAAIKEVSPETAETPQEPDKNKDGFTPGQMLTEKDQLKIRRKYEIELEPKRKKV